MDYLTPLQANDLANQFLSMAQSIGDFRYQHWNGLSTAQHQRLSSLHRNVLTYGEDILVSSTVLVMEDMEGSLAAIRDVTGQIRSALGSLEDIQKGINVATAIVALGAAIVSRNPLAVAGAIEGLGTSWKTLL